MAVELDSSALKGSVAFTGRLACMTRAEAFEVVRQHGGAPSQAVTKRTNLLIVGELGWPLLDDGRPSNKLTRATAYRIPVVSERRFLEWIGKAVPEGLQKTYSGEQLSALSKLYSETIQELVQFGLLDERGGCFGFRDLASARQIAKLLADGVRLSEIVRGVSEIRRWLPEAGLSSVRLCPGPGKTLEVEQPAGRTDKRGQFLFAVDGSEQSPDDLFAKAQTAEEAGDIAEAERLYRILMKSDPRDASAPFNLGNMLPRPPAPWSRFPAPIGPESGTMPTEHGFRFDDLQRVENVGSQGVHAGKDQPVDAGEGQTARGLSAEHIQLVPEHQDFGFQLGPRPEEPSESAPDQLAKVDHRPGASTDSRRLTSRTGFPVGTPLFLQSLPKWRAAEATRRAI